MSLKKFIKKIIPEYIITLYKMRKQFFYFYKIMRDIEREKIKNIDFLIGTPIHTNLGDHLITLSEQTFLKSIGYHNNIIEIPIEMFKFYQKKLLKIIDSKSTIFINGGGWMGDLWPGDERLMQNIVKTFKNNKIIIFPQTIYYDDINLHFKVLQESVDSFSLSKNLTLYLRDENSFFFAKKYYKNIKMKLIPDIAISYYNYAPKNIKNNTVLNVGVCFRNDREVGDETSKIDLLKYLKKRKYNLFYTSMISKKSVTTKERNIVLKEKLLEFTKYDLILTDRLHGMIFAVITETPCIIFDNKTHKVKGVYEKWLKNNPNILPVFNDFSIIQVKEFINMIEQNSYDCKLNIDEMFKSLREDLLNG